MLKQNPYKSPLPAFILCSLVCLFMSSCLSIDADVEIAEDGSGKLQLEYRISRMVESMGKMDGSERWLPLPVGRADFERSLTALPGLSLDRFTTSKDERDIRISAGLSFSSLDDLASFLSANGRNAAASSANGRSSLSLRLSDSSGELDADLQKLVVNVFEGYDIRISIRTPRPSTSTGVSVGSPNPRTAVFSTSVAELLTQTQESNWVLSW